MKIKSKIYSLIFIFIFEVNFFLIQKFCLKCIDNYRNLNICFKCPNEIIFNGLEILSNEETLNEIIKNNKSISRFGDGEYKLLNGGIIKFQKKNSTLLKKLKEIIINNQTNFLVGINLPYKIKDLNRLTEYAKKKWINYLHKKKFTLVKLFNKNNKYYSSTISRFYMRYKNKKKIYILKYIQKLKKIWDQKDILIIEGETSRVGIGNDLFNNIKSLKRIICPVHNAFNVYNKIIEEVLKLKEKRLILIALGPTATILAFDFFKLGYQAIDIGHLDIEYEWFLNNATKKIQIKNKFVNEARGVRYNFTKVKDKNYYSQIIAKILN